MLGEQFGEQPQHRLAILQHVGDARRRADIVLEHMEVVLAGAHHIDAGHVDIDPMRRRAADRLQPEVRVAPDQVGRHDPGAQAFLGAIEVGQEGVQRLDPLAQAALEMGPFALGNHPRHDVEGDQPLGRLFRAIDREGDADPPEQDFGLAPPRFEQLGWRLPEPRVDRLIDGPNLGRLVPAMHFVIKGHSSHETTAQADAWTGRRPRTPQAEPSSIV